MDDNKMKRWVTAVTITVAVLLVLVYSLVNALGDGQNQTKIACVGDSLTYGYGLSDRSTESWPAVMSKNAGANVGNFGVCGATAMKDTAISYWDQPEYQESSDFGANIVVIMLGTNDASYKNWDGIDAYLKDMKALINHYRLLESGPNVFVATPPRSFENHANGTKRKNALEKIHNALTELCKTEDIGLIDIYEITDNRKELYQSDGVHINADGDKVIAEAIGSAIVKETTPG